MSMVDKYRGELWELRKEAIVLDSRLKLEEERKNAGFPGDDRSMYECYEEYAHNVDRLTRERASLNEKITECEKKVELAEKAEQYEFDRRQEKLASSGTREDWQERDTAERERMSLLHHREKQDEFRAWQAKAAGETVLKQGREKLEIANSHEFDHWNAAKNSRSR